MLCPNCNSLINENATQCPECGVAIPQNENFNNFFTQNNPVDNNYQNSQNYQQNNFNYQNSQNHQQNNFNGAYPNSEYFNQPQYASDAGESNASTSQICGILSLFLGPILAIVSLVFASKYKKVGNGQNASKVKVGKICSWISIGGTLLGITSFLLFLFVLVSGSAELLDNTDHQIHDESFSVMEEWSEFDNDENDKPMADGEFGSSSDFNGIYRITGYVSSLSYLNLYLAGVDNENSGSLDVTDSSMEKYVTNFNDYIYVELTFKEGGLKDWNLIDISTSEDLGKPTEEELIARFNPEENYEIVSAGNAPDEILLSNYEVGKTYVFDINNAESEYYNMPNIINDTNIPVLSVATKTNEDDDFSKDLYTNKSLDGPSIHISNNDDNKLYLAITEITIDFVLKTEDCFYLSKCVIGEEIDFDFEDYLYNDTDKTFTLSCEGSEYTLAPGEIAKCSWMYDIMVISAE